MNGVIKTHSIARPTRIRCIILLHTTERPFRMRLRTLPLTLTIATIINKTKKNTLQNGPPTTIPAESHKTLNEQKNKNNSTNLRSGN